MKVERKYADLGGVTEVGNTGSTQPMGFYGVAAVIGSRDTGGDRIVPGAFKRTLRENPHVVIKVGHQDPPVGRITEAVETEEGLLIHGVLSRTTGGRDARTLLIDGVCRGLSIGYAAKGKRTAVDPDGVYCRELTDVDLYEVSLVPHPMHTAAGVGAKFAVPPQAVRDALLVARVDAELKRKRRVTLPVMAEYAKAQERLVNRQLLIGRKSQVVAMTRLEEVKAAIADCERLDPITQSELELDWLAGRADKLHTDDMRKRVASGLRELDKLVLPNQRGHTTRRTGG
jgi:hypothetical protein